jgi:hypothetical protein
MTLEEFERLAGGSAHHGAGDRRDPDKAASRQLPARGFLENRFGIY